MSAADDKLERFLALPAKAKLDAIDKRVQAAVKRAVAAERKRIMSDIEQTRELWRRYGDYPRASALTGLLRALRQGEKESAAKARAGGGRTKRG